MRAAGSKKFRVIIGIDDRLVAKDLTVMLNRLDCLVTYEAHTTTDLILKIASEGSKPDIVLLQLGLQGEMDAVSAAWEIYEKFNVPTLYIVAAGDKNLFEKMSEKYYYGHLRKPFDQASISQAMQKAIVKHLNEYLKKTD